MNREEARKKLNRQAAAITACLLAVVFLIPLAAWALSKHHKPAAYRLNIGTVIAMDHRITKASSVKQVWRNNGFQHRATDQEEYLVTVEENGQTETWKVTEESYRQTEIGMRIRRVGTE